MVRGLKAPMFQKITCQYFLNIVVINQSFRVDYIVDKSKSELNIIRSPIEEQEQGLRQTWKLRQCAKWKVNLLICEPAKASNREKWSVRLVCLADTLSWSVLLIHLADFSCWLYAYYTTCIITGKAHMLQSANDKVTSNPPYILHFPLCTSHLITLHLTHCILHVA